jgi:hypothetical protein
MTASATPRSNRPKTRSSWVVLCLFVLLTLILSWPVTPNLGSRMPGTATWAFDESTFAWNIWYFQHALLNLHTSPLHSELIWYPLGIDLILYTYNFFNALIALPLVVAASVPLASNVTILLATALSGLGAYLLACYVLRATYSVDPTDSASRLTYHVSRITPHLRLAAFLAGLIYAFASNRAVYAALGHYDMVTTQWLPFYALYLLKTLREPGLKNIYGTSLRGPSCGPKQSRTLEEIASGQKTPLAMTLSRAAARAAGLKNPFLAGLFLALAALAEMIFASFLALFTAIVLLALWREVAPRRAALGRLAVAGVVAAALWAPALIPIAREFITGDYALTGWGESVKLSADLAGLVTPTDLNPLGAAAVGAVGEPATRWQAALRQVEEGKGRFGDINTVFLGFVTVALAFVGAVVARRRVAAWLWTTLVFGVLSLGPLLQINGRYRFSLDALLPEGVTFPLPFALLHFIPFINANRAPNRNSVLLMLGVAVLAAWGAGWVLGRVGGQGNKETRKQGASLVYLSTYLPVYLSTCLLATLLLLEHLALPLPTTDARAPEIYRMIGAEPGEFAVMQLPLGWRNSFGTLGSEQTNLQYFQTMHGKALVGGNISRAPAYKMDYFARIPLFKALTDLELYRPVDGQTDAAARAGAASLMALYDVRYFITTPPIPGRYPYQDTVRQTEAYALEVLPLEKPAFWAGEGYKAYRVIQGALALPFRADVGTGGAEPHLARGWDVRPDEQPYNATANWITERTAELYLPLAAPQAVTLRLAIAPLSYPGAPPQKVSIRVNDMLILKDRELAAGWQTISTAVPASVTRRGPNRVRLEFTWAVSPRRVFPDAPSRAIIGETGVVSPMNLDVHAFSEAYISAFGADGREVKASAGRRGYNIAVFDQRTGALLDQRGFDTAANSYEADALAAYLSAIPRGRIVVAATKGDAAAHLTPAAVTALRGLGSRIESPADLAGRAHALVGVQTAQPDGLNRRAAEAILPDDAFVRVAGDFRTLAAAVDWVEWGP